MQLLKVYFLFAVFSGFTLAVELCPELFQKMLYVYQKGLVARLETKDDIHKVIQEKLDKNLFQNDLESEKNYTVLLDHILMYLTLPKENQEKALNNFSHYWGVDKQDFKDIALYYSYRYFKIPTALGPVSNTMPRVTELHKAFKLVEPITDKEKHLALRYRIYLVQLGHWSVPELAKKLNTTEKKVYQELSDLNLSIDSIFSEKIEEVKKRLNKGETTEHIAQQLGYGTQALRFYLHYEREKNKITPWNRTFRHPASGREYTEEEYLKLLWINGLNLQEIANKLNIVFDKKETDPEYRSEASIYAKILSKGWITNKKPREEKDLEIAGYGQVKKGGNLITDSATKYILDHSELTLAELALELGVTESSLRKFINRHNIVLPSYTKKMRANTTHSNEPESKNIELPEISIPGLTEKEKKHLIPILLELNQYITTHQKKPKGKLYNAFYKNFIANKKPARNALLVSMLEPSNLEILKQERGTPIPKVVDEFRSLINANTGALLPQNKENTLKFARLRKLKGKRLEEFKSQLNENQLNIFNNWWNSSYTTPIETVVQEFKSLINADTGALLTQNKENMQQFNHLRALKGKRLEEFKSKLHENERNIFNDWWNSNHTTTIETVVKEFRSLINANTGALLTQNKENKIKFTHLRALKGKRLEEFKKLLSELDKTQGTNLLEIFLNRFPDKK